MSEYIHEPGHDAIAEIERLEAENKWLRGLVERAYREGFDDKECDYGDPPMNSVDEMWPESDTCRALACPQGPRDE